LFFDKSFILFKVQEREKLVPLDGDFTKCYLYNKIKNRGIKDIICEEPLVVDGDKIKENATFLDQVESGDNQVCSEKKN
jgi:hypothetical protein